MTMNNASADAVAVQICNGLGVTDAPTIAQWKQIMRPIWAGIVADLIVTLNAGTVITVGSAATQTGPATPVTLIVT